jgi:hypothetical protein
MPVELQVIRASEFIRLDPGSHLDFEASKNVLRDLAHACRKRGLDRAMVDLRSLPVPPKPIFTVAELAALVLTFQDAGFTRQQRLAILYNSDVYGGIRNFAFISRMRGLKVQAFTDFESAFQWLSEETGSPSETQRGEVAVPIKARSGVKKAVLSAAARARAAKETRQSAKQHS